MKYFCIMFLKWTKRTCTTSQHIQVALRENIYIWQPILIEASTVPLSIPVPAQVVGSFVFILVSENGKFSLSWLFRPNLNQNLNITHAFMLTSRSTYGY